MSRRHTPVVVRRSVSRALFALAIVSARSVAGQSPASTPPAAADTAQDSAADAAHGGGTARGGALGGAQGSAPAMAAMAEMPADSGSPTMHMRAGPLGIGMTRQGSGTSWLPDGAPMHAQLIPIGGWQLMIHGVEFGAYDQQFGGSRGATQLVGIGWLMGAATHALGDGQLGLRGMFSADPWTTSPRGYPLILQSGEAFNGTPLHDRQHPHNLFMELAAIYDTPIAHGLAVQVYAAPVGEPAVGPVAFPHRPSAQSDPFAPLSHHWQDATHISFGVATVGIYTHDIKLESSFFNGHEPDQHRSDIEYDDHGPVLDSYSGRLTVNPDAGWSVSTWYAYLHRPEQLEPTVSQHRLGASVLNDRAFGSRGRWSSALIYGANLYSNDPRLSNSALVESNLDLDGANTVFGRLEYVAKSPADLFVDTPPPPAADRFNIGSASIGYARVIGRLTPYLTTSIGAVLTLDAIPQTLAATYHTRTPGGIGVYLRIRAAHSHGADEMSAGMTMR
jgi:hypothetical protein